MKILDRSGYSPHTSVRNQSRGKHETMHNTIDDCRALICLEIGEIEHTSMSIVPTAGLLTSIEMGRVCCQQDRKPTGKAGNVVYSN